MKLGSHELTFNLKYQDRRNSFSDNIPNTFRSRIMQKKIEFLKRSHWLIALILYRFCSLVLLLNIYFEYYKNCLKMIIITRYSKKKFKINIELGSVEKKI